MKKLAALALLPLALTACSTSTHSNPNQTVSASPSSSSVSVAGDTPPANPVDTLRKIAGCKIADGTTQGSTDLMGNRYAECTIGDNGGDSQFTAAKVTVKTAQTTPPMLQGAPPDDDNAYIYGPTWWAEIEAAYAGGKVGQGVIEKVHQQLGGKIATSAKDLPASS